MSTYLLAFIIAIYNPVSEPPQSMRIGFTLEKDVPANAVIYYDTDSPPDGEWDIAYSHPIMPGTITRTCGEVATEELYMVLTNCPSSNPHSITVLREPNFVRRPNGDWISVYKVACGRLSCEMRLYVVPD